jgi:hypothetical protein
MRQSNFQSMIGQAMQNGLSVLYSIDNLTPPPDNLSDLNAAYQEFLRNNPDFNDGTFEDEAEDLHKPKLKEIVEAEIKKAKIGCLVGAIIVNTYSRNYEPGSEGTGWHNDINTGADLIIVHTLFGSAHFDAINSKGKNYSATHGPGSVIAFTSSTQHCASSPLYSRHREIEGIGIKLAE